MSRSTVDRIFLGSQTKAFVRCRGLREDGLGWEYGFPEKKGSFSTAEYYINGHLVESQTIGEYTDVTYHGVKIYEDDFVAIPNSDDVFQVFFRLKKYHSITEYIRDKQTIGRFMIKSPDEIKELPFAAVVVGNMWEDKEIVMPDPEEAGFVDLPDEKGFRDITVLSVDQLLKMGLDRGVINGMITKEPAAPKSRTGKKEKGVKTYNSLEGYRQAHALSYDDLADLLGMTNKAKRISARAACQTKKVSQRNMDILLKKESITEQEFFEKYPAPAVKEEEPEIYLLERHTASEEQQVAS